MAAIALPQFQAPLRNIVGIPPVPQNPPSIPDVAAAIRLCHEVYDAHSESRQSRGAIKD